MSIGVKLIFAVFCFILMALSIAGHWGAIAIAITTGGFFGFLASALVDTTKKAAPSIKAGAKKAAKVSKDGATKVAKVSKKSVEELVQSREKQILNIEDEFFRLAGAEIEDNKQDQGLWFKAFALADGDQSKQKALYISLRAERLHEEQSVDKEKVNTEVEVQSSSELGDSTEEEIETVHAPKTEITCPYCHSKLRDLGICSKCGCTVDQYVLDAHSQ